MTNENDANRKPATDLIEAINKAMEAFSEGFDAKPIVFPSFIVLEVDSAGSRFFGPFTTRVSAFEWLEKRKKLNATFKPDAKLSLYPLNTPPANPGDKPTTQLFNGELLP